jgi:oxygen-independent coproporphyrinogen-3 oxidase
MTGTRPEDESVPDDGGLPPGALTGLGVRGFSVYVHVPFCTSRCGYCDFNTYAIGATDVSREEGTSVACVEREGYIDTLIAEVDLAGQILGATSRPPIDTVFVGGGTPTLLAPSELGKLIDHLDGVFGITPGAEITTEANPETVDAASLRRLRAVGFNRVSLGAQSVVPHVLRTLERRHSPQRALSAVSEARSAGFEHVNLDLIYGTPGESPDDFAASLAAVIGSGADHVSAYALIVEEGTRLERRMRRGELPFPDDDVAADRYLAAEETLSAAGFDWYEVSNWARGAAARCRHNLGYWRGTDWWGFGAGAHSHVGGVRWWNVKHPAAYRSRLASGRSPGAGREILTPDDQYVESVLLGLRLAEGIPLTALRESARIAAAAELAAGLLDPAAWAAGRVVLTVPGRLLADGVIRRLLAD